MNLSAIWESMHMTNQPENNLSPELLNENKMSINSFLRESYSQAKSFIRDEYDRTRDYINRMSLPVNNFLKDLSQIETELIEENTKSSTQYMLLDGQLIPVEQVLLRQMEENY